MSGPLPGGRKTPWKPAPASGLVQLETVPWPDQPRGRLILALAPIAIEANGDVTKY